MGRPFKRYELKTCPRPLKIGRYRLLSNTVQITGVDGAFYYCYVTFSDALVHRVGTLLGGLMISDPAVLWVRIDTNGTYTVGASLFLSPARQAILWSAPYVEGTPEWLKFIKVKQDGNTPKAPRKGKAARRSGSHSEGDPA